MFRSAHSFFFSLFRRLFLLTEDLRPPFVRNGACYRLRLLYPSTFAFSFRDVDARSFLIHLCVFCASGLFCVFSLYVSLISSRKSPSPSYCCRYSPSLRCSGLISPLDIPPREFAARSIFRRPSNLRRQFRRAWRRSVSFFPLFVLLMRAVVAILRVALSLPCLSFNLVLVLFKIPALELVPD